MLNNEKIIARIRAFGRRAGLNSDNSICDKCKIPNRMIMYGIKNAKTAPRIDTLQKFACGLGVSVEDLIYDRTDADVNLSRLINQLSEYEKTKVAVYIEMLVAEKNKQGQKKVA